MTLVVNGHYDVTSPLPALASAPARLVDRIAQRDAVVAVIGLGYVGLPLAVAFAGAGLRVLGIDVDGERVARLNRGHSPVADVADDAIVKYLAPPSIVRAVSNERVTTAGQPRGALAFTDDARMLCHADAAVICVPTPLGKAREPDLTYVISATEAVARHWHPGLLVVLESTTYPGTTEEVMLPRLQAAAHRAYTGGHEVPCSPRSVGEDFFLAFSPERIDPGRTDFTVRTTPKIVGGATPACCEVAAALYRCAVDQVITVSNPRVAEMVKLHENTFRMLNIGLVNELAIMCGRLGVDVWEVIDAAATKPFGFMPFYPGPGLGGHCIPIDPHYLDWKMRAMGYNARFIRLASDMNEAMPDYVADKVAGALNDDAKAVKGSRVIVLGVAYKANVSDLRESPAMDLIEQLRKRGAHVSYHDPLVDNIHLASGELRSVGLDAKTLQGCDCAVIVTAHSCIDWSFVVANAELVVDTRNALAHVPAQRARVVKL